MSKYGQLIKEARKQENQKTRKIRMATDLSEDPDVNLSIKVATSRRRHWVAEAKRQGTSLTAAITEALNSRFGEPE
jgi:hypothetical protein